MVIIDFVGNAIFFFNYFVLISAGQVIIVIVIDFDNNMFEISFCTTVVNFINFNFNLLVVIILINFVSNNLDSFGYLVVVLDDNCVIIGSSKSDWSETAAVYLFDTSGTLLIAIHYLDPPGGGFGRTVVAVNNKK